MSKAVDFVFLDSGTGGLPYMELLKQCAPASKCVYVADTKNFPYGQKTHEQIIECAISVVDNIIKKFKPKIIVLACNTISVNALDVLRETFSDIFFVGTVPAIKLAAKITKNKCIGLLATKSTVENPYNMELKNHFARDCKMVLRADPDLISFVEHKSFTATRQEQIDAIMPCIEFFISQGCDTIILGCTHFLNLKDVFEEICKDKISIVDSRQGVVNRALQLWDFRGKGGFTLFKKNSEKSKLYITGFIAQKDENEYNVVCKHYDLKWCGIL